jgi:DtxR family transcriptional regulator, Mn-dependent transcriptional regulator
MMDHDTLLSAQMEDYLETIFHLCSEHGAARVNTIAKRLDVSTPSVVGALKNLKRRRLVHQEPYGVVHLTDKGKRVAWSVVERHRVLASFLQVILGLDSETASVDACKIEHVASAETIHRIRAMADFIQQELKIEPGWPEAFKRFYERYENIDGDSDDTR